MAPDNRAKKSVLRTTNSENAFGFGPEDYNPPSVKNSAPIGSTTLSKTRGPGAYLQALIVSAALVVGEIVALAQASAAGGWILGRSGYPVLNDFMAFWVAGKFALEGTAAKAYDFGSIHAAQIGLIGHDSNLSAPFFNTPMFLFLVAPLAALPYPVAFVVFVAATAALYSA